MLFACVASAVLAHSEATFGFPEMHRGVLPGLVSVATQQAVSGRSPVGAERFFAIFRGFSGFFGASCARSVGSRAGW